MNKEVISLEINLHIIFGSIDFVVDEGMALESTSLSLSLAEPAEL